MAGTVKKLQFTEGTDVGAPTDLSLATSTTTISEYADDAAFVTANGSATAGDVYINSTAKVLRYYTGSAWRNAVPAMDPTDATKTFLIDISGNTTGVSATLSFGATGNRIYAFPDVAITVAGRANSETLSNKTLASPLISGGSIDTTGAGALAIGASVGANNMTLGGASSTVIVAGNLQVNGTTTTVNSTVMEVADANVLVNNGGNDASSEGSGLTVERTGTNGSFIYKDASGSKFACGPAGSELDVVTVSATQNVSNKTFTVCDFDGGTASNTSRMTLPKASTATLSGLNRKQGTLAFDTTLGLPVFDTGSAFAALATASTATPTSQGNTTSYFPVIQSGISVVTNADATATTSDGFLSYLFSTGNTNRTLTLPAASANAGRLIYVKKTDAGTGSVTVTRAGSDTIDSATTFVLSKRFEFVAILCDSTGTTWDVVGTNKAPTIQTFTSGSGTYTSPANAVWIKVFCTGGGGGGGGDTTNGSAGSDSTFSTLTGSGGAGGIINSGGGGGSASGGDLNIPGGGGMFGTTTASPGGNGGATFWGAGGRGCSSNATGSAPDVGTAYGAGGGGGGNVNNLRGGGGGGGTAVKTMEAGSYSYSVGSSGSGGSTGGAGPNGAAGASGIIYVEEHYV